MKIEICNNTKEAAAWLFGLSAVVAVILGITAITTHGYNERMEAAFKAGLEEINDTCSQTHWGYAK